MLWEYSTQGLAIKHAILYPVEEGVQISRRGVHFLIPYTFRSTPR